MLRNNFFIRFNFMFFDRFRRIFQVNTSFIRIIKVFLDENRIKIDIWFQKTLDSRLSSNLFSG